jgi:hypothetical protein
MDEPVCVECGEQIDGAAAVTAGKRYHWGCYLVHLHERILRLEDALRPFAECWTSPEPRYPLEEHYRQAAEVLNVARQ